MEQAGSLFDDRLWRDLLDGIVPRGLGTLPRTQSAGTSGMARQSGGDSMTVEDASSFESTLARIRQRYALHFYLPEGVKPGDERAIEVELSAAARRRYPGAEVRYRRSYLAPNGPSDSGDSRPTWVSLPRTDAPEARSVPVVKGIRTIL